MLCWYYCHVLQGVEYCCVYGDFIVLVFEFLVLGSLFWGHMFKWWTFEIKRSCIDWINFDHVYTQFQAHMLSMKEMEFWTAGTESHYWRTHLNWPKLTRNTWNMKYCNTSKLNWRIVQWKWSKPQSAPSIGCWVVLVGIWCLMLYPSWCAKFEAGTFPAVFFFVLYLTYIIVSLSKSKYILVHDSKHEYILILKQGNAWFLDATLERWKKARQRIMADFRDQSHVSLDRWKERRERREKKREKKD